MATEVLCDGRMDVVYMGVTCTAEVEAQVGLLDPFGRDGILTVALEGAFS